MTIGQTASTTDGPYQAVLPGPSTDMQRDAAMARSYPPARMVDGGASAEAAFALHTWATAGLDWI